MRSNNKKFLLIAFIFIPVIFLTFSKQSFSRRFERDFFPDGYPEYLRVGGVQHDANWAWALIGDTKSSCEKWQMDNEWSEPLDIERVFNGKEFDISRDFFIKLLKVNNLEKNDINRIYFKSVGKSDIAYFLIMNKQFSDGRFGILCVFRV